MTHVGTSGHPAVNHFRVWLDQVFVLVAALNVGEDLVHLERCQRVIGYRIEIPKRTHNFHVFIT